MTAQHQSTDDELEFDPTWPRPPENAAPEWSFENRLSDQQDHVSHRKREVLDDRDAYKYRLENPLAFIRDVREDEIHAVIDHNSDGIRTHSIVDLWYARQAESSNQPYANRISWNEFNQHFMETPLREGDQLYTFETMYHIVGFTRDSGILKAELRKNTNAEGVDRTAYVFGIHDAIEDGQIEVGNYGSFYRLWADRDFSGPAAYYALLASIGQQAIRLARTDDAAPDDEDVADNIRNIVDSNDASIVRAVRYVERQVRHR